VKFEHRRDAIGNSTNAIIAKRIVYGLRKGQSLGAITYNFPKGESSYHQRSAAFSWVRWSFDYERLA